MKKAEESPKEYFLTKSNNDNSPFKILESIEHEKEDKFPNNMIKFDDFLKSSKKSPINKKIRFSTKKKKIFSVLNKKTKKKQNKKNDNNKFSKGRWTQEERYKFADALHKFGAEWKKINNYITTRSSAQIISHAQKFLSKLIKNEYIIKKGIDLKDLNWEKSYKCLKDNLNDSELLFVLTSIECDIGDNKRMTNKYIERKSSMINKNVQSSNEHIKLFVSEENNNNNNNELNIIKEEKDNNNKNENSNSNEDDKMNIPKKDNFLEIKNNDSDNNIFFNENFNLFSFDNNNIFDSNGE